MMVRTPDAQTLAKIKALHDANRNPAPTPHPVGILSVCGVVAFGCAFWGIIGWQIIKHVL